MQRLAGGGGKVVERDRERDSQRRMQCQCVVEAARRTEHTHVIYHDKNGGWTPQPFWVSTSDWPHLFNSPLLPPLSWQTLQAVFEETLKPPTTLSESQFSITPPPVIRLLQCKKSWHCLRGAPCSGHTPKLPPIFSSKWHAETKYPRCDQPQKETSAPLIKKNCCFVCIGRLWAFSGDVSCGVPTAR